MDRKLKPFNIEFVLSEYPELRSKGIKFYYDVETKRETKRLLSYFKEKQIKKRLRLIIFNILDHGYHENFYKNLSGFNSIAEMIFPRSLKHLRIYCKEFSQNGKKIVMITTIKKDFNSIKDNKPLRDKLTRIDKTYNYKF